MEDENVVIDEQQPQEEEPRVECKESDVILTFAAGSLENEEGAIDYATDYVEIVLRVRNKLFSAVCDAANNRMKNCYIDDEDSLCVAIPSNTFKVGGVAERRIHTRVVNDAFEDGYKDTWGQFEEINLEYV